MTAKVSKPDQYQCLARAKRIEAQGHKPGSMALKVAKALREEAAK